MFDDFGFMVDEQFLAQLDDIKKQACVLLKSQRDKMSGKDYSLLAYSMAEMLSFSVVTDCIFDQTKAKLGCGSYDD